MPIGSVLAERRLPLVLRRAVLQAAAVLRLERARHRGTGGQRERPGGANAAAQSAVPRWRSRMQTNEIKAISGNTLTLKDPLDHRLPDRAPRRRSGGWSRRTPSQWSLGQPLVGHRERRGRRRQQPVGLSRRDDRLQLHVLRWAKNVEADGERGSDPASPREGRLQHRARAELPRAWSVTPTCTTPGDENPGGQAYGIVVGTGSSACLVENNISVDNNKPIASIATGGGNVIAYNYVDKAVIWTQPGWQENAHRRLPRRLHPPRPDRGQLDAQHRRRDHARELGLARPLPQLRHRPELVGQRDRQPARGGRGRLDLRQRLRGQRAPTGATCTRPIPPPGAGRQSSPWATTSWRAGTGTTATPRPTSGATGTGTR